VKDPMEEIVHQALHDAKVPFVAGDSNNAARLDFYLPVQNLYIEVKQFHSPRIAEQMARSENVIVLQGRPAVEWFAEMINRR
jgi:hypothetical protein